MHIRSYTFHCFFKILGTEIDFKSDEDDVMEKVAR